MEPRDPEYPFSSAPPPTAPPPGRILESRRIAVGEFVDMTIARVMRFDQPLRIEARAGVEVEVLAELAQIWNPQTQAHDVELVLSVQPTAPHLPSASVKLRWPEPAQDPALSRPPRPGEMKVVRDSLGRVMTIVKG